MSKYEQTHGLLQFCKAMTIATTTTKQLGIGWITRCTHVNSVECVHVRIRSHILKFDLDVSWLHRFFVPFLWVFLKILLRRYFCVCLFCDHYCGQQNTPTITYFSLHLFDCTVFSKMQYIIRIMCSYFFSKHCVRIRYTPNQQQYFQRLICIETYTHNDVSRAKMEDAIKMLYFQSLHQAHIPNKLNNNWRESTMLRALALSFRENFLLRKLNVPGMEQNNFSKMCSLFNLLS